MDKIIIDLIEKKGMTQQMNSSYEGQIINDRYRIEHLLGKGGMGAVYAAKHVVLGKTVAVKFLHLEFVNDEDIVKRFYREAQAAAAIGHTNIIEVLDVGVSENQEPYLVMEYLEGESLATLLQRKGTLDFDIACGIMEQVLDALHTAHTKGIIHRDLKPDNIFLAYSAAGHPTVKIIDFGISKFTEATGQSQLTKTGSLLGTPAYMSPEQARGDKGVDARADIYSMGVILYQMLSGRLPFRGENYNQLLINILTEPPVPPKESFAAFPAEAEPIVMDAVAKQPEDRIKNAFSFIELLSQTSAWKTRIEALAQIPAEVTHTTFASGDLGHSIKETGESNVASSILGKLSAGGTQTPGAWAGTNPIRSKKTGRTKHLIVATALVSLLAFFIFYKQWNNQSTEPVLTPAAPIELPRGELSEPDSPNGPEDTALEGIEIHILDVPEGAQILYNGAPVPNNPFRVDAKSTLSTLKILAEGYTPMAKSIVPQADVELTYEGVLLKQDTKPASKRKTVRKPISSRSANPALSTDAAPKPQSQPSKFSAGKRGTKFGKEFE